MREVMNTEYHQRFREYCKKSYINRGHLQKKIRYLEKKLGLESTETKSKNNEEMLEIISDLSMKYTHLKNSKFIEKYKKS